ncbi:hypothetical protein CXB51_013971 [Gossypium anomalum]|uniref:CCHC-type domain-containing protein n=1 Tax=Gossypium anomalum TaxID=47600 RepID=A0A8J5Z3E7_9ROSI|nr:hypothetical protein CXB51_013971 [Gossypium anomalum]
MVSETQFSVDRETKKVRFKNGEGDEDVDMFVDLEPRPKPWTKYFDSKKPCPSVVLAWIRLPGLPEFMYKRRILEVVRGLVGKGELQQVEYEALPTICFLCGNCGHLKEMCPTPVGESNNVKEKTSRTLGSFEPVNGNEEAAYEPWMVVEQRNQRG